MQLVVRKQTLASRSLRYEPHSKVEQFPKDVAPVAKLRSKDKTKNKEKKIR